VNRPRQLAQAHINLHTGCTRKRSSGCAFSG
jgi:hypothetical protein